MAVGGPGCAPCRRGVVIIFVIIVIIVIIVINHKGVRPAEGEAVEPGRGVGWGAVGWGWGWGGWGGGLSGTREVG